MGSHPDRAAALASLRARWGAAAPRPAVEVFGPLGAAPLPAESGAAPAPFGATPAALVPLPGGAGPETVRPRPERPSGADRSISSGFAELDALLAAGGLPRAGTVVVRGAGSSGATTLALRAVAEAQAGGALAAWVDLPRSLDPVEAVSRGVRLEWLAVLVPASAGEALEMAGTLLQARAVDVLVLDLAAGAEEGRPGARPPARRPRPAEQLARLVAFARHAGALLLVLEPAELVPPLRSVLREGADLLLELRRRGWICLGREVVGQRAEVLVAKDRHGAPDRRTTLRLLYAEGGPRDRCLARDDLLVEAVAAASTAAAQATPAEHRGSIDAHPPPRLAPPRPAAGTGARPRHPGRQADRPRWAAVG